MHSLPFSGNTFSKYLMEPSLWVQAGPARRHWSPPSLLFSAMIKTIGLNLSSLMYYPHPSQTLTKLFAAKPYQGVLPDRAKFLFIGLDANYSDTIETDPIFPKILEYHDDGAEFWRQYGVHHPFLLNGYKGSGRYYHKSFAEIGFGPEDADTVSFAELLHLPTTGQSKLEIQDLDVTHLQRLKDWILDGQAEYIFFPAGVAR